MEQQLAEGREPEPDAEDLVALVKLGTRPPHDRCISQIYHNP